LLFGDYCDECFLAFFFCKTELIIKSISFVRQWFESIEPSIPFFLFNFEKHRKRKPIYPQKNAEKHKNSGRFLIDHCNTVGANVMFEI